MNIDLKGFTEEYYSKVLGGDLGTVKAFIEEAVKHCHVEITTLIVPGMNDSEEEMREMASWIAQLAGRSGKNAGRKIPLHISRFFPAFHMTDRGPTEVRQIRRLAEIAGEQLDHVYTGNC